MGAGFGGRCRAIGSSRSRRLADSTPTFPRLRDDLPIGASKNCWITPPVAQTSNTTSNLINGRSQLVMIKGGLFMPSWRTLDW